MEIFQNVIQWILNLGSAIFVPLIIFVLGLMVGMNIKKPLFQPLLSGLPLQVWE